MSVFAQFLHSEAARSVDDRAHKLLAQLRDPTREQAGIMGEAGLLEPGVRALPTGAQAVARRALGLGLAPVTVPGTVLGAALDASGWVGAELLGRLTNSQAQGSDSPRAAAIRAAYQRGGGQGVVAALRQMPDWQSKALGYVGPMVLDPSNLLGPVTKVARVGGLAKAAPGIMRALEAADLAANLGLGRRAVAVQPALGGVEAALRALPEAAASTLPRQGALPGLGEMAGEVLTAGRAPTPQVRQLLGSPRLEALGQEARVGPVVAHGPLGEETARQAGLAGMGALPPSAPEVMLSRPVPGAGEPLPGVARQPVPHLLQQAGLPGVSGVPSAAGRAAEDYAVTAGSMPRTGLPITEPAARVGGLTPPDQAALDLTQAADDPLMALLQKESKGGALPPANYFARKLGLPLAEVQRRLADLVSQGVLGDVGRGDLALVRQPSELDRLIERIYKGKAQYALANKYKEAGGHLRQNGRIFVGGVDVTDTLLAELSARAAILDQGLTGKAKQAAIDAVKAQYDVARAAHDALLPEDRILEGEVLTDAASRLNGLAPGSVPETHLPPAAEGVVRALDPPDLPADLPPDLAAGTVPDQPDLGALVQRPLTRWERLAAEARHGTPPPEALPADYARQVQVGKLPKGAAGWQALADAAKVADAPAGPVGAATDYGRQVSIGKDLPLTQAPLVTQVFADVRRADPQAADYFENPQNRTFTRAVLARAYAAQQRAMQGKMLPSLKQMGGLYREQLTQTLKNFFADVLYTRTMSRANNLDPELGRALTDDLKQEVINRGNDEALGWGQQFTTFLRDSGVSGDKAGLAALLGVTPETLPTGMHLDLAIRQMLGEGGGAVQIADTALHPAGHAAAEVAFAAVRPSRLALGPAGAAVAAISGATRPMQRELFQIGQDVVQRPARLTAALQAAVTRLLPEQGALLDSLAKQGVDVASVPRDRLLSVAQVSQLAGPAAGRVWAATRQAALREGGGNAKRIFGDFSTLSAGGKALRVVSPFARWSTQALPRGLEQLAKRPGGAVVLANMLKAERQYLADEGLPSYLLGSVPLPTSLPGVGAMTGGRDGTTWVNPLSVVSPVDPGAMDPEALTSGKGYDRVVAAGGLAGLSPGTAVSEIAYALGLTDRRPGPASRLAKLVAAADNPQPGASVPDVVGLASRGVRAAVTGKPQYAPDTPTATTIKELVYERTGKPLADPRNLAYQLAAADPTSSLSQEADTRTRLALASQNVVGLVSPANVTTRTATADVKQRAVAATSAFDTDAQRALKGGAPFTPAQLATLDLLAPGASQVARRLRTPDERAALASQANDLLKAAVPASQIGYSPAVGRDAGQIDPRLAAFRAQNAALYQYAPRYAAQQEALLKERYGIT